MVNTSVAERAAVLHCAWAMLPNDQSPETVAPLPLR